MLIDPNKFPDDSTVRDVISCTFVFLQSSRFLDRTDRLMDREMDVLIHPDGLSSGDAWSIFRLNVSSWRPCDINEIYAAWHCVYAPASGCRCSCAAATPAQRRTIFLMTACRLHSWAAPSARMAGSMPTPSPLAAQAC